MNDHFSIDLETLGTRYNAPVLSIGVVQFDPDTGKLGAEFYREIDIHSALKAGQVNGSTLAWWAQQSEKARRVFGSDNKVSLATVLDELSTWLRGKDMTPKVWGNGAGFDITILEHAYDNGCVGLKEAWHFTNIRDMRTLVEDAQLRNDEWPKREGVHHNALDDAKYQALVIAACRMKINKALGAGVPGAKRSVQKQVAEDDEL